MGPCTLLACTWQDVTWRSVYLRAGAFDLLFNYRHGILNKLYEHQSIKKSFHAKPEAIIRRHRS